MADIPINAEKAWTLLIFMAGDNDLSPNAGQTLKRLKKLSDETDIHIAVQVHTRPRPGVPSVQRLHVLTGRSEVLGGPLPDLNTGDPATLSDFLAWGRKHFPAERTALIIWGHGTGLQDLPANFDYSLIREGEAGFKKELERTLFNTTLERLARLNPIRHRGIAVDATARDYLDTAELHTAIKNGLAVGGGGKLDLLGFDACLMSCVEIAYQLRDVAEIMVGSQDPVPAKGWPYDAIVNSLAADPSMTANEFADLIGQKYHDDFLALSPESHSLSILNLSQVAQTFSYTYALVEAVEKSDSATLATFKRAFQELRVEKLELDKSRDVADFYRCCRQIRVKIIAVRNTPAYQALQALNSHLSPGSDGGLVRSCRTSPKARGNVHGVSVYWPQQMYSPVYEALDWQQSGWGGFVRLILARS